MKKRLLSLLLALTLACSLLVLPASAVESAVVWSTSSNDTVLMVSCDGAMPDYSIANPAEWSKLKSTVKTVIVEDGVKSIGEYAFNGFTALESVSIPDSVAVINAYAFSSCTKLESVTIPEGVTSIETSAFNGCCKLTTLTLAQTVKCIKQNAFKDTDLKDVYFGGTSAKWNVVKNNSETGNDPLFAATLHVICETHTIELQNIVAPTCDEKGYTGDEVCKVCGTVVSIGKEVPATGHEWKNWRPITSGQQRVCSNDSKHVETIKFPADTVLMPKTADLLDEATESITVPNSRGNVIWLKWISEGMPAYNADVINPFSDVSTSDLWYDAVLWAVEVCIIQSSQIFLYPNEMLTAEQVAAIVGDGTLPTSGYEKDIPHVVTYETAVQEWVIPAPTEVNDANFTYVISSDGKSVSIKSYKGNAEKVIIPEKVAGASVVGIREGAFQNKAKMTEVTIPATVTSIGNYAFDGCNKLQDVYFEGTEELWKAISIGTNNDSLTSAEIYYAEAQTPAIISGNCGVNGDNVTWNLDGDGVLTISGEGAMEDYRSNDSETLPPWYKSRSRIMAVVIEPAVTRIGIYAFIDCINMSSVVIPDTVSSIGFVSFAGCSSLTSVVIPNGVTSIEDAVFANCSSLKSIVIPESVTSINNSAFEYCTSLTKVMIPDGVISIGSYAFQNCSRLDSLSIPTSVTSIKHDAFSNCTSLTDVYYSGNVEQWAAVFIGTNNEPLTGASIHYSGSVPAKIESDPADVTMLVGKTVSFSITASGDVVSYQWQVSENGADWADLPDAVAATLELTAEEAMNGNQYRCVITDKDGNTVTSEPAALTVAKPVVITGDPADSTGKVGQVAAFAVEAEGEGLTYQWQYSDNGGAAWTTSTVSEPVYSAKLTSIKNGRLVRCIVTDAAGNTVTSEAASMRIEEFRITQQPEDVVAPVNSTVTFTVAAEGSGLTYQWQYSDNGGAKWTKSSASGAVYVSKLYENRDGRLVRCVITNSGGQKLISDAVSMRIG